MESRVLSILIRKVSSECNHYLKQLLLIAMLTTGDICGIWNQKRIRNKRFRCMLQTSTKPTFCQRPINKSNRAIDQHSAWHKHVLTTQLITASKTCCRFICDRHRSVYGLTAGRVKATPSPNLASARVAHSYLGDRLRSADNTAHLDVRRRGLAWYNPTTSNCVWQTVK